MANSMGTMLSSTKMTLFGDPLTAQAMMSSFMKAAGIGVAAEGFISQYNPAVTEEALKIVNGSGEAIQKALSGIFGRKIEVSNEQLAEIVAAIVQVNGKNGKVES
jgi:hypothetical protein